jgi:hypothetical protein
VTHAGGASSATLHRSDANRARARNHRGGAGRDEPPREAAMGFCQELAQGIAAAAPLGAETPTQHLCSTRWDKQLELRLALLIPRHCSRTLVLRSDREQLRRRRFI